MIKMNRQRALEVLAGFDPQSDGAYFWGESQDGHWSGVLGIPDDAVHAYPAITVHGIFTLEQFEAIAWWMRSAGKDEAP